MLFNIIHLSIAIFAATVSAQHGQVTCASQCYWAGYHWNMNAGYDILTSSGSVNETIKYRVCTTTFINQGAPCGNSSNCDVTARENAAYLKQAADVCGYDFETSDFGDNTGFWVEDDYCGSACRYLEQKYTNCTSTNSDSLENCLCLSSSNWANLCGSAVCASSRQQYTTSLEPIFEYCNWTADATGSSAVASSSVSSSLATSVEVTSSLISSSESTSTQETTSVEPSSSVEASSVETSSAAPTSDVSSSAAVTTTAKPSTSAVSTQKSENSTVATTVSATASQTTVADTNEAGVFKAKSTPALFLGIVVGLLMA